jgi:hypothetical protein
MNSNRVQLPQELVDYIVDFLHDSEKALQSCALASRACIYRAQAHLFSHIVLADKQTLWVKAQITFQKSPHLIRHIRRLDMCPRNISSDTFAAICTLPLTHLRSAYISSPSFKLSPQSALGLQQLHSLPTLRDIELQCCFAESATFQKIWDRCSSSVQHLDLDCRPDTGETFRSMSQRCSPALQLKSLRLLAREGSWAWLQHPMGPFDFSSLKALSIRGLSGVMSLAPCANSLQVLEFSVSILRLSVLATQLIHLHSGPNRSSTSLYARHSKSYELIHGMAIGLRCLRLSQPLQHPTTSVGLFCTASISSKLHTLRSTPSSPVSPPLTPQLNCR